MVSLLGGMFGKPKSGYAHIEMRRTNVRKSTYGALPSCATIAEEIAGAAPSNERAASPLTMAARSSSSDLSCTVPSAQGTAAYAESISGLWSSLLSMEATDNKTSAGTSL